MERLEQQVECSSCNWNKQCILPPSMTREEVEAKINEAKEPEDGSPPNAFKAMMLVSIFGTKDMEAHVCPVFADELRKSAEMSNEIKELMKSK